MDWSNVIKLVKPFAPTIAGMLGGPLAGVAVSILGGALGLGGGGSDSPLTPETLQKAIEKGGDGLIAYFQSAEEEAKARYGYLTAGVQADAAQSQTINETVRAEVAKGISWWHWRHLLGYGAFVWMMAPLPLLGIFLVRGDSTGIFSLIQVANAFTTYFVGYCALLGYVAGDTTRRVTTAMTGQPQPSLLGTISGVFTRKGG